MKPNAELGIGNSEYPFRTPHSAFRTGKGQTTAEYAVLIAVVVGALLAMQIYVKRGAMGRLKDAADQIGDQFSPVHTHSKFDTNFFSQRNEQTFNTGASESTLTANEIQGRKNGTVTINTTLQNETLF